jgi:hypothetical protein
VEKDPFHKVVVAITNPVHRDTVPKSFPNQLVRDFPRLKIVGKLLSNLQADFVFFVVAEPIVQGGGGHGSVAVAASGRLTYTL